MKTRILNTTYALALGAAFVSGSVLASTEARGQVSATATAPSPVNLSSDVKIERVEIDAAGKEKIVLHEPKDVVVVPGDRILFTLNVTNSGAEAAAGFRAVNPLPAPVTFTAVTEDWAEVSVDGGTTWGKLTTLSVKAKAADTGIESMGPATGADVTHVRWIFAQPIAPGTKTAVSYRGIVK